MDTMILKFGGSSVADLEKLHLVADHIKKMYDEGKKLVIILSAQGKTTDRLSQEAKELASKVPDRELDMLLSSGEQISSAKLSILLNSMGYPAISLTGWQAGIYTNSNNQNAMIERINITRILEELEKNKIVIIAGFQGVNENMDITTLGRGGSDTTALAIAAALKTKECYIYSDVDGVYTADPKKVKEAKKLPALSYEEMKEISSEGAKVLHNRCVEIGEKFKIPIITKSTFQPEKGTVISDMIEENTPKSIIKKEVSRISIVGNGMLRNIPLVQEVLKIINENHLNLLNFEVSESKISITFKDIINDQILSSLHEVIFHEK